MTELLFVFERFVPDFNAWQKIYEDVDDVNVAIDTIQYLTVHYPKLYRNLRILEVKDYEP
jgi:hypothetical protein